jgi:hypothetical protein
MPSVNVAVPLGDRRLYWMLGLVNPSMQRRGVLLKEARLRFSGRFI